jgi:hypothetical protein
LSNITIPSKFIVRVKSLATVATIPEGAFPEMEELDIKASSATADGSPRKEVAAGASPVGAAKQQEEGLGQVSDSVL